MATRAVFKYEAPVSDDLTIEMPVGAEVLCVHAQNGPKIWARVDAEAPKVLRRFHWRGMFEAL